MGVDTFKALNPAQRDGILRLYESGYFTAEEVASEVGNPTIKPRPAPPAPSPGGVLIWRRTDAGGSGMPIRRFAIVARRLCRHAMCAALDSRPPPSLGRELLLLLLFPICFPLTVLPTLPASPSPAQQPQGWDVQVQVPRLGEPPGPAILSSHRPTRLPRRCPSQAFGAFFEPGLPPPNRLVLRHIALPSPPSPVHTPRTPACTCRCRWRPQSSRRRCGRCSASRSV